MSNPLATNRREFLTGSALAAVAANGAPAATTAQKPPAKRKTKIRIGCRFGASWLKSPKDADLKFFKQIGVDYVDIELGIIKGYHENGIFAKRDFMDFVKRLANLGLKIERSNSLGHKYLNAHLNLPEGREEIGKLRLIAGMMAEAEIPVFGIQTCQASLHIAGPRGGWVKKIGRGGYAYSSFSIARSKAKAPKPKYRVPAKTLWKGLLNQYRAAIPAVEGSKTVIAMHGNDPPLYEYLGNPQIICRFKDFDRLFNEVPSKHNGITFCVGTRYESGEDIFEGIRRFGKAGKLFHVHFRNVKGTLPASGGYAETFIDDGDMDMAKVVRALDEVGYSGVIDYDHPITIQGDGPLPKQCLAYANGYMRGLLHGL